ncbi:MAG: amidohydrolase [Deltaproteobacteria bacterium]|nr:amidohydrolase [Deltaproteobacteria bacterium]
MKEVDLLVSGAFILTLTNQGIIEDGAIVTKGNIIFDIGKKDILEERYLPKRRLEYGHGLIMPGLINAHTHIAMTLFRGLADDLPLMEWLNEYIFPAERKLTAEMVYWGSLLGCAEMILSGTTTFCDMYLFSDQVAEAANRAGIRAVVGEVLYDFPSPNYGDLENGFRYTEELINKWKENPLISVAVEPHALFTCSPDLFKRARDLAERYSTPLIIHLSETEEEVKEIKRKYGCTPVRHLHNLGILDKRLIAAHCVILTEDDILLLAKHQVNVVHNPESNLKLASGIAPIPKLLESGITVALGTDGPSSNNDLDMFLEMGTAARIHKVKNLDPEIMKAEEVLKMATINGAIALGLNEIGTLKAGKRADIIVIDLNRPHLIPMYNPYSHLVYSATGSDVITTIIDGKIIMENRELRTLDLDEIKEKLKEIIKKLGIETT